MNLDRNIILMLVSILAAFYLLKFLAWIKNRPYAVFSSKKIPQGKWIVTSAFETVHKNEWKLVIANMNSGNNLFFKSDQEPSLKFLGDPKPTTLKYGFIFETRKKEGVFRFLHRPDFVLLESKI